MLISLMTWVMLHLKWRFSTNKPNDQEPQNESSPPTHMQTRGFLSFLRRQSPLPHSEAHSPRPDGSNASVLPHTSHCSTHTHTRTHTMQPTDERDRYPSTWGCAMIIPLKLGIGGHHHNLLPQHKERSYFRPNLDSLAREPLPQWDKLLADGKRVLEGRPSSGHFGCPRAVPRVGVFI